MQSKGHIVITVVSIFNTELDSKSLNSVPWFPFLDLELWTIPNIDTCVLCSDCETAYIQN